MQIEDYLYQKGLHEPLSEEKPFHMRPEDWELLDRQALGVVRLSLAKNVAYNIVNVKTTHGLIKALSDMYEKPSASNKVFLIRQLVNLKMMEGSSATDHINEFNSILSRLISVDIKFEDEVQALLLLSSLPESWSGTVTAVSSSVGGAKLTFESIRNLILSEDVRRRSIGESSSSLLSTEDRGRKSNRGGGGRGRSKSRKRDKGKKEVNMAVDSEDDALICCVENSIESWIMDSGASFHASHSREVMQNFRQYKGKVRLADNKSLDITGVGDVVLKTTLGTDWTLKNVKFIPDLKRMLISVGQLDDEGHHVTFGDHQWKVTKGNLVVARGQKRVTLYMVEVSDAEAHAVEEVGASTLWHQRLGHMSEKGMKMLVSKGRIPELKTVKVDFCEPCVLGKQKKVTFKKIGHQPKSEKLELVHSDVYGPTSVSSVGGSRYYVTFIDDCTRKVWVYFLKHKSEVFSTFKKWKATVENETDLKIKCFRSDNGGEYSSKEFVDYCANQGIRMQKTVPETPQQNGVAERMNRTLNERAKSMRLHAGLPKMFWADAVSTAAYLINKGPSVPIGFKIPEEEWQGRDISLKHLKVFGCVSYVKVKDSERDKLEAKARKCTFIGYGLDDMGYRFWDNQNKKVIRSRDVVFNENVLYKDELAESSGRNKQPEKTESQVEFEEISEDDVVKPISTPEIGESSGSSGSSDVYGDSGSTDDSSSEDGVADDAETSTPTIRRSTRVRRPPVRYSPSANYLLLTENGEPESYPEALRMKDSIQWKRAMEDELSSLDKNQTWSLVKLPAGKKALQNKWVFRVKDEIDGSKRYKARLVVKGFQQKRGVDYNEIFSPVVKMTTIRMVLGIVASEDLHLEQLDVKTAFLHGDLEEDIYMAQPEGFPTVGKENLVCKLKKSLYGLKQAPRQWYLKFDSFMQRSGYHRCEMDHCCYLKKFNSSYIILLLYVDDMLIAGSDMQEINKLKKQLSREFEMKDLGAAKQILGMSIARNRVTGTLKLSQTKYIKKVLEKFSMADAKARSTPLGSQLKLSKKQSPKTEEDKEQMAKVPYASAVGSLMYAMVCTRPDIAHAVGVVSRFMSNPGKEHWEGVKWLLRYLKGTSEIALCFRRKGVVLEGFADADLGGCADSGKSTTGYVFTIGGTAISWMSRLQKSVALSTTEAEYMAIAEAAKELIWLKNFLSELGFQQEDCVLHCDNQSAGHLSKNPVFHNRTKHIQMRYHFIRELINDGTLNLKKILGTKNPADMFTKVVTTDKLKFCMTSTGLLEV
ncbi:hypothetical protein L2E82_18363 [Cichorium intybus]|uniref:Uncharacterized protein n=1 Tax=Cichorium intybus TaxID=13427 RepID=A0ACB9F9D9_CICIN|nr:hypothetical protein L2E82_18363 [Cichorium intybus]